MFPVLILAGLPSRFAGELLYNVGDRKAPSSSCTQPKRNSTYSFGSFDFRAHMAPSYRAASERGPSLAVERAAPTHEHDRKGPSASWPHELQSPVSPTVLFDRPTASSPSPETRPDRAASSTPSVQQRMHRDSVPP